ncbi:MAG: UMP kinase [Candidatus Diapherotrites archaeon]
MIKMFDMFNQQEDSDSQENQESEHNSDFNAPSGNTFVLSIGGSLLVKAKPDSEMIQKISEAISELHSAGKRIVIVVGGGKTARNYVEAMNVSNNFEKDLMGIQVTRANAFLLASQIPECHKEILTEIPKVKEILDSGKIPVFGGLMPFFTTDAVGALLAEFLEANFVNITNVDGIYNANPKDYPDAKRYDEISYSSLIDLISSSGSEPGQNVVLDLACCMILKRSLIPAVVLDGNDIENLKNYINGYSFIGTTIKENASEEMRNEEVEELMEKPKRKPKKKRKIKVHKDDKEFSADDVDYLKL